MSRLNNSHHLRGPIAGALILTLGSGFAFPTPAAAQNSALVKHALDLSIDPAAGTLMVQDDIDLADAGIAADSDPRFELNAGLTVQAVEGARFLPLRDTDLGAPGARYYRLRTQGGTHIRLRYRGVIETRDSGPGAGRIDGQGVYLDGSTRWYPRFGDRRLSFTLRVRLPGGWKAISQGERLAAEDHTTARWREQHPQEDIYLVAGRYRRYARTLALDGAAVVASAYLHTPDPALAARYLDATGRYLSFYSHMLGTYPYAKFALVEGARGSGFGMPSFTLIGPRVLRLPFLLESSYPHEILHNWWGNGVYVDRERGNWSEGLTAYLADYLIRERQGRGKDYRRAVLQRYRSYVNHARDFPLRAFRAAHGDAGQAVGYGKALMVLHMLRSRIGDRAFIAALREFYRTRRFRRASWSDLRGAFEAASGVQLGDYFAQWIERSGAPELRLQDVKVRPSGGDFRLTATLRQAQTDPAWRLRVPIAVVLEGRRQAAQRTIEMGHRKRRLDLRFPRRPVRLVIDPAFDVFRRLADTELPPSLGELLGSPDTRALLPASAPPRLRQAYRRLARRLGAARVDLDSGANLDLGPGPVWILGWGNRARGHLAAALRRQGAMVEARGARLPGGYVAGRKQCIALVLRDQRARARGFIACDTAAAFAGLGRKLPHYGRYGYLVFDGDAPTNRVKGEWRVSGSPLDRLLIADHARTPLRLAARPSLADFARPGAQ